MSTEITHQPAPAGADPAPAPPTPPAVPQPAPWLGQASATATAFLQWLSQPRVRLAVVGAVLLAIGGLFMTSSVWTLPLVVVGALMVAIAWIGCRLDGRFAVEWGQTGTQLEFRAKIKAPQLSRAAAARPPAHEVSLSAEPEPERAGVIDGEAHTVEINVAELEALIAAVETQGAQTSQPAAPEPATPEPAAADFRVARGPNHASEAVR